MNRSMKILSVVEATNVNAVAKVVLDFYVTARELSASRDELLKVAGSIVTFDRANRGQMENDFALAARRAGVELDTIPERRRFDLRVLSALERIVAERQPDIIVTNSVKSHFVMWRSRIWRKYPWAAFHHGYTMTDRKMLLYNRFDRWSLPKADVVVTVCNAFAKELMTVSRVPPERLRVQHNSIRLPPPPPPELVNALRAQLGLSSNQCLILSVGRLSKEKAHADLIEAFKQLCDMHPELDSRLLIVGDGPEREPLEAAARVSGIGRRIIFAGQAADVRPYYTLADVFVLPSHSEGSPNVLLEAMAARVPVVATAVGGVLEIVENEKSALVVPAGDLKALSEAIARVLRDSSLGSRLAESASVLLARNHTPETYVNAIVKIYDDAISGRTS